MEFEFDFDNYDVTKDPILQDKTTQKKRKKNPVNDDEFTYEILLSKGLGKLTKKAEKNIITLVENAIKKIYYKFDNYDDIQDTIQTTYLNFLQKWQGFNPDIASSAFSYFTELHKRSSAEFMNEWKKMRGIKKEEQHTYKRMSINSSNQGKGIFNI